MMKSLVLILALIASPALAFEAPKDQAACEAIGGEWSKQGASQKEMCDTRTEDAGKPCEHSSECESELCVQGVNFPDEGQCFGHTAKFGCHDVFDTDKAKRKTICID